MIPASEAIVHQDGKTSFVIPDNVNLVSGVDVPSFDTPASFEKPNEAGSLRAIDSIEEAFNAAQRGTKALRALLDE